MICREIPKPMIPQYWPYISGWLGAALDKGDRWWSTAGIYQELMDNPDCALFIVMDRRELKSATVIMVEDKQNGQRFAHVPACGGKGAKTWVHFFSELEDWARSRGAQSLSVTGRKGWTRLLPQYRQSAIVLERTL